MSTRTLQGVATIWSDNSHLPGPRGSHMTATLTIHENSGQVNVNLQPMNLGNNIILKQNGDGVGHYHFDAGNLEINVPVHVENVPIGRVLDTSIHLSTALSISPPNTGVITGVPASTPGDATGSITFVGTTKVILGSDTLFGFVTLFNNTVWIREVGTLFSA